MTSYGFNPSTSQASKTFAALDSKDYEKRRADDGYVGQGANDQAMILDAATKLCSYGACWVFMPGKYFIDDYILAAIPEGCILKIIGRGKVIFYSSIVDNGVSHGVWEFTPDATSRLILSNIETQHGGIPNGNRTLYGTLVKSACKSIELDRVIVNGFQCYGVRVLGQVVNQGRAIGCEMSSNKRGGLFTDRANNFIVDGGKYDLNGELTGPALTYPTYGYGVSLNSDGLGNISTGCVVKNIQAFDNIRKGIDMHGGGRNMSIHDNKVRGWGTSGIDCTVDPSTAEFDDAFIHDNIIDGTGVIPNESASGVLDNYGILVGADGLAGTKPTTMGSFLIHHNVFKNMDTVPNLHPVRVYNQSGDAPIKSVKIEGNDFRDISGSAAEVIQCPANTVDGTIHVRQLVVKDNTFAIQSGTNSSAQPIIRASDVDNLIVSGNTGNIGSRPYFVINDDDAANMQVKDNTLTGTLVTGFTTAATGGVKQRVRDNMVNGLPGWNRGSTNIPSGATTKVVAHGLYAAPGMVKICFKEQGTAAYGRWWVDTMDATNFTLNVTADPGASNLDFAWEAEV